MELGLNRKVSARIKDDSWGKWFDIDDPDGKHWLIVHRKKLMYNINKCLSNFQLSTFFNRFSALFKQLPFAFGYDFNFSIDNFQSCLIINRI
jgi:hypothetical protein